MTPLVMDVVLLCVVVVAVAAVVLAVRQRQRLRELQARLAPLEAELVTRDQQLRHFTTSRLPALFEGVRHGVAPVAPRYDQLADSEFARGLEAAAELVREGLEKFRERGDESARASLRSAMRTVQSLANEQQASITAMQEQYDNPGILEDLLRIDHQNSQIGRRAQAVAVLCGAWPGRQRIATPLTDVVRGATSRIRDYLRVRIQGEVALAVVGRAVEPVVLALAELLDNAARHSQPQTAVQVSIKGVSNGAVIEIDDGGVGMHEQQLREAALLLSGQQQVDVTRLGDPPRFGFPVISVLAGRYGFRVAVDLQSPYGGVRAVVFLPAQLLTMIRDESPTLLSETGAGELGGMMASTAGGLPKRRRQEAVVRPKHTATGTTKRDPSESAAIMGAFQRGTRSGRAARERPSDEPPIGEEGSSLT